MLELGRRYSRYPHYPKPRRFQGIPDIYRSYYNHRNNRPFIDQYGHRRRQYQSLPDASPATGFRPHADDDNYKMEKPRNRPLELYEIYTKQFEARKKAEQRETTLISMKEEMEAEKSFELVGNGSADQVEKPSGEAEGKPEITQEHLAELYEDYQRKFGSADVPKTEIAGKEFYVDGWEGEVRTERFLSDDGLKIPINQFPHAEPYYELHPEGKERDKDATEVVREWERRLEEVDREGLDGNP